MIVCLHGGVNSSCLYSEKIEQKRKLRPDLGGNRTDFYSTSMAEQSCSPSEFSAGRSCDSGVVWSSEAQLTSAAAVVTGSLLSVSAHPSACLAVPDNWKIWNESLFLIKSGVHKHGERRRKKKNITRYTESDYEDNFIQEQLMEFQCMGRNWIIDKLSDCTCRRFSASKYWTFSFWPTLTKESISKYANSKIVAC